jgi:hypothetical protein
MSDKDIQSIVEDLNRIELLIQYDKKQMALDLIKYVIEDIKVCNAKSYADKILW